MSEKNTELSRPLVVGHKRDGRSCYDAEAKRELIEACLRPGVSVARIALQHGVNANLLRTWIARHRREGGMTVVKADVATHAAAEGSAFIPVVEARMAPAAQDLRVTAEFPNGVRLNLSGMGAEQLSSVLHLLWELPCSGSTAG